MNELNLVRGRYLYCDLIEFFFSSRRRHTRWTGDWSSDMCSSDLLLGFVGHRSPASHDPAGIALGPAQARSYALKLLLSFAVTAAGGLLVKKLGWELPDTVRPVAWALIIGAAWMLVAEQLAALRARHGGERSAISWTT